MRRNYKDIIFGTFCLLIFSCSTKDNLTQDASTLINLDSVIQTSHKITAELFFRTFNLQNLFYGDDKRVDSLYKVFTKINLDTLTEKDKVSIARFKSTVDQKLHLLKSICIRKDSSLYFLFLNEKDCALFEQISYDTLIKNKKVIAIEALVKDTYYFDEKAFICDSIISIKELTGQTQSDKPQ